MDIVVLGSGCSKCHSTTGLIERVAKELGIPVNISLNTSKEERERPGVHSTPAVLVNGRLVHSGGIPSHEKVEIWLRPKPLDLLNNPTRHLFFTGKGGVGKTSLSTAVALHLADCGKKVLLVSTDSASNLDEMLGVPLSNHPTPVPGARACPFSTLTRTQRLGPIAKGL
ncbi:arsenical pump-driving ATPase ArsA [Alicycliphilus sp. B1]|nr:arsenical pump-driving ATPase ArsA [Alicycliphilus sp. B1]